MPTSIAPHSGSRPGKNKAEKARKNERMKRAARLLSSTPASTRTKPPNMGGFVRVDAGVLDNNLAARFIRSFFLAFSALFLPGLLPECGAIEVGIQVPRSRNFHARDTLDLAQAFGNLLRNRPRRLLQ